MSTPVRLQKFLASCGLASRRKAEEFIAAGRVRVDGKTVTSMGVKIDPSRQQVLFDNKAVKAEEKPTYLLLNKPVGYVTTLADPQGRPIVTSLLGKKIKTRLFPVGRLDLNTGGALILTDDGELAQKIQHPSFEVNKTYEALVKGHPQKNKLSSLSRGIMLDGKKTFPAKLIANKHNNFSTLVQITIHEGRKRQVRKMFQAIGHPVLNLTRIAYGQLMLNDLEVGKYRFLNEKDIKKIFSKKIPLQK